LIPEPKNIKMKKAIILLLLPVYFHANAQQENENEKIHNRFEKQRLFTGGTANLGFSSGTTMIGVTPQLGYSVTDWMDAGITVNFNYVSQRDSYSTEKWRQTIYGPGAFVRLFPVKFLFASAQYEYNFINQKYIPASSSGIPSQKTSLNANSLLVGGGYAGGREKGNNTYYFLSIAWDIMSDKNSPYVDNLGRSNPVIRAGYNIGLFQGRYRR
jgi:hypothetical protein